MFDGGDGGFESVFTEMRSGGFQPGTSTSRSTTTFIENGKRITRTTTTQRFADGRVETHVSVIVCSAGNCVDVGCHVVLQTEEKHDEVPMGGYRLSDESGSGSRRHHHPTLQDSSSSGRHGRSSGHRRRY
jgi:hypothetical protein